MAKGSGKEFRLDDQIGHLLRRAYQAASVNGFQLPVHYSKMRLC